MSPDMFMTRGLRAALLGSVAGVLAVTAAPVMAQDAADDEEEKTVVVTGSRISRSNFTSDSPLTVVSGEAIRDSGLANLGEALKQQLGVTDGGFSQTNVLNGGGATSIDLRGLGSDRVLVLINGKRIANFADSLQNEAGDLSFIPIAMVERVEILRDGASTTYGQDAISGVVNVILKDDYEGLTITGVTGLSTYGDAETTNVSAVMGGNFERGNAVIGLEYRFADNVPQRERDWATPAISSLGGSTGSFFSPGGVYFGSLGTACADWVGAPNTVWPGGPFAGTPVGGGTGLTDLYLTTVCPSFGSPALAGYTSPRGGYYRFSYDLEQDLFTQQSVFSGAAYFTYDITDSLEAFTELQYSKRESTRYLSGNPGTFVVPANNPSVIALGLGGGTMFIRPSTTVGTRDEFTDADQIRSVVGLRGTDLFSKFDWELAYLWTQVNSAATSKGEWSPIFASLISDPVRCGQDPVCSLALTQAGKTPGVDALNPILPGTWAPSEIDYIRVNTASKSEFQSENWFALVNGPIFDLPAGELGLALGAEHRTETGSSKPDTITEKGYNIANRVFPTEGSYEVTELYAELDIPLVKDLPFVKELRANVQGRWFDYSNFGADEVWKASVNWAITEDVRLRFNQGTAFRAPTIVDLFSGGTQSFQSLIDPCNNYDTLVPGGTTVVAGATLDNDALIANCGGAGVPAGYFQVASQVPTTAGGNENLEPETADTLTIGLVLTPRWIPNLQATVDWYQIEVANFIGSNTLQSVANSCFGGATVLSDPTCALFVRNAVNGEITDVQLPLLNSDDGVSMVDGFDFAVTYFFDDPLFATGTTITFDVDATYLASTDFQVDAGTIDAENTGNGRPRWQGIARLNFENGPTTFSWQTRYIADMKDPTNTSAALLYRGPEEEIEHDIRLGYDWNNVSMLAGVNNVFDEEPPYVYETGTNTANFIYQSAMLGRYFFGRVTVDF